eukprot:678467-Pleurochrysis_carterae.AAC.4
MRRHGLSEQRALLLGIFPSGPGSRRRCAVCSARVLCACSASQRASPMLARSLRALGRNDLA